MMDGRIWFPGNPWPNGHRIAEFEWTGRTDNEDRTWFDLSLVTADYDEEGYPPEPDEYEVADFASPIVWSNYHRCTLSSTAWEDATGILAAGPGKPVRLDQPLTLTADPLPPADPDSDPAFHVYLLGHDSTADHRVRFRPVDAGGFDIVWDGRLALTYAGQDEFRYTFHAEISGVDLPSPYPGHMPLQD